MIIQGLDASRGNLSVGHFSLRGDLYSSDPFLGSCSKIACPSFCLLLTPLQNLNEPMITLFSSSITFFISSVATCSAPMNIRQLANNMMRTRRWNNKTHIPSLAVDRVVLGLLYSGKHLVLRPFLLQFSHTGDVNASNALKSLKVCVV